MFISIILRSEEQLHKIFRIIRELLSQKKRRGKMKEIEMARFAKIVGRQA